MKSNSFALLIAGLLLVLTCDGSRAASPARLSADGVEFPAAPPERKFRPKVALAGAILGQRPEDVGRVFNAKKSAALLAKRTTQDLGSDWFILKTDSADIAGLTLTDGRVSRVVLFYEVASTLKINNLRKQVEANADPAVKVTVKPIEHDRKQSLMIVFEVDPVEFYLAVHTIDPKIADALRKRTWTPEMTDDQALLIGDGPGKYLAIFGPDDKGDAVGAGTVFAEGGNADIRVEVQAKNKQEAREQAMKQHKNLKTITKMTATPETGAGKK